MSKTALLDGDIYVYRVGFACEDEEDEAIVARTLRLFITDILLELDDVEDYQVYITGKGNFRDKYAVTVGYKENRKGMKKPKWYSFIREQLINDWGAYVTEGQEADDAIAIEATLLGDKCIIVSIDKDFNQIKGWKYNFVKKDLYYVTEEEGVLNFYCQFLEGDKVDNIIGVKGIGPKKAKVLLEGKTAREMYEVCVEQLGSEERAIENGRLLYLRRETGQIWEPPND